MERHPSEMTPVELRCLRESLGFTVRALSAAIGRTYQTITRWESGEHPISAHSAAALADLVAYTSVFETDLAATHPAGSTITTYLTDKAVAEFVDTGGRVLSAAWHRGVAWRAAKRTGATVVAYAATRTEEQHRTQESP